MTLRDEMLDKVFNDGMTVTELVALFYAVKIPPKKMEELIHAYALNFAHEYYAERKEWENEGCESWIE